MGELGAEIQVSDTHLTAGTLLDVSDQYSSSSIAAVAASSPKNRKQEQDEQERIEADPQSPRSPRHPMRIIDPTLYHPLQCCIWLNIPSYSGGVDAWSVDGSADSSSSSSSSSSSASSASSSSSPSVSAAASAAASGLANKKLLSVTQDASKKNRSKDDSSVGRSRVYSLQVEIDSSQKIRRDNELDEASGSGSGTSEEQSGNDDLEKSYASVNTLHVIKDKKSRRLSAEIPSRTTKNELATSSESGSSGSSAGSDDSKGKREQEVAVALEESQNSVQVMTDSSNLSESAYLSCDNSQEIPVASSSSSADSASAAAAALAAPVVKDPAVIAKKGSSGSSSGFSPQRMDDGRLEVVALKDVTHLVGIQTGLVKGLRLAQGPSFIITLAQPAFIQVREIETQNPIMQSTYAESDTVTLNILFVFCRWMESQRRLALPELSFRRRTWPQC
jgi:hypothetical protein